MNLNEVDQATQRKPILKLSIQGDNCVATWLEAK